MKKSKKEYFDELMYTLMDGDVLKVENGIATLTSSGCVLSKYNMNKEEIEYF